MKIKSVTIKEKYSLNEFTGEFWVFEKGNHSNGSVPGIPAFNDDGLFLWGRLEEGLNVEELIQALAKKRDLDIDEAEADVFEFLARLINGKIVDTHS